MSVMSRHVNNDVISLAIAGIRMKSVKKVKQAEAGKRENQKWVLNNGGSCSQYWVNHSTASLQLCQCRQQSVLPPARWVASNHTETPQTQAWMTSRSDIHQLSTKPATAATELAWLRPNCISLFSQTAKSWSMQPAWGSASMSVRPCAYWRLHAAVNLCAHVFFNISTWRITQPTDTEAWSFLNSGADRKLRCLGTSVLCIHSSVATMHTCLEAECLVLSDYLGILTNWQAKNQYPCLHSNDHVHISTAALLKRLDSNELQPAIKMCKIQWSGTGPSLHSEKAMALWVMPLILIWFQFEYAGCQSVTTSNVTESCYTAAADFLCFCCDSTHNACMQMQVKIRARKQSAVCAGRHSGGDADSQSSWSQLKLKLDHLQSIR